MKLERLVPLLLVPNIAMAKGGGAVILLFLFFPILIWICFKVWSFWFRLIANSGEKKNIQAHASAPKMLQDTKECPYCAEIVLAKAKKCKHCGSDL